MRDIFYSTTLGLLLGNAWCCSDSILNGIDMKIRYCPWNPCCLWTVNSFFFADTASTATDAVTAVATAAANDVANAIAVLL